MPTKAHKAASGRLCRSLALAWALVPALPVLGAGSEPNEILFVRPESECGTTGCGTGNGSTYANAYGGYADVADSATPGTANTVDPDDTLIHCGSFKAEDVDSGTTMRVINRATVTNDGDCLAYGGPPMASWDGEGVLARGFDSGSSGAATQTIKNFSIRGFTEYGILGQNAASINWTIQNIDCDGSLLSQACIRNLTAGATGWQILGGTMSNCSHDCIYSLTEMTIDGTRGREWGTGQPGDFIQFAGAGCNGVVIRNVDGRSTDDLKQAIIVNTCTVDANVTVEDSYFEKLGPASSDPAGVIAIFVEHTSGTLTATRNFIKGHRKGIYAGNGVALVARNNLIARTTENAIQCGSSSGDCTAENNSIASAVTAIDFASAAVGTTKNNAISGAVDGIVDGLGDSETYNAIVNVTGDACIRNGSPATCGTGNVSRGQLFVGGDFAAFPLEFAPSAQSALIGAGSSCTAADYFGESFYSACEIGAIRRDQCYRRNSEGAKNPARTRAQIVERCRGIPGRYPEGM